ncbi:hypothetical protein HY991_02365, partial [Candidatus Micrarchaeota archaeon]|nr:hypothetical protein [Candidatus Micrarchaeota archaeon]
SGRNRLRDWFERLGKRIETIHLHDSRLPREKEPEDHFALGHGNLDVNAILGEIKKTTAKHLLLELYKKGETNSEEKDFIEALSKCKNTIARA